MQEKEVKELINEETTKIVNSAAVIIVAFFVLQMILAHICGIFEVGVVATVSIIVALLTYHLAKRWYAFICACYKTNKFIGHMAVISSLVTLACLGELF